ncbi:bifunctional UDP-N-acetylglucosamine diphosphorylase/glucosamine-1-phosphate N-acetyltransferase GlmU [Fusobacterium massiliense]|uniref:bifunctional UDP-N-acetylglucosamine diphosphorylase/glucosamine-1-phosphate N-acetyltransferase GlmU n=1 Tax=Fusobacterium massiliense TaxID=1852365 RepID=UPI0028D17F30|nr:bifunctional UDP-N-acetylglucosamine diphosphorylase/glucosamine-1-phosphate N-acetyltransferase GlmU [Fusobacterium massiliense]
MSLKSIIMAAGKGSRMMSELPKVIHLAHSKPMVVRIIDALNALDVEENVLILGHKREKVLEVLGNDISYVIQEEQLGTGHAVKQAEEKIKNYNGDILIINGDIPLIQKETLVNFYNEYKKENADGIILTAIFDNPFSYGRIFKENDRVLKIVEEKEANEEQKKIKEVNAGVYIFKAQHLAYALRKINNNNEKGEYYLTDVIEILASENKKIISYSLEDSMEIQGVNSKVELALVSRVLRERKNKSLMESGVILIDPATTYIDDEVKIGKDTVIYPNVTIQKNTEIGENCEILSGTRIIDSKILNNVRIENSVIEESIIENGVTIGPFAHLRPKSHLKENVHIGNFVETKKSTLEKGVKAGHLTYLGDAHVGEKTNIGAGTITCNYDGKNKFKTEIGENVFIGSDTMLVAPVNVGANALVGAGSVITKDVPNNSLAVSRSKQIIKEGWRKEDGKF